MEPERLFPDRSLSPRLFSSLGGEGISPSSLLSESQSLCNLGSRNRFKGMVPFKLLFDRLSDDRLENFDILSEIIP